MEPKQNNRATTDLDSMGYLESFKVNHNMWNNCKVYRKYVDRIETVRPPCWPPKRSADVSPRVSLRNPLCTGNTACKWGNLPWFWNPGQKSPEVQNTKRTDVLQFKKRGSSRFLALIKRSGGEQKGMILKNLLKFFWPNLMCICGGYILLSLSGLNYLCQKLC